MPIIEYVGLKESKADNVAGTGLVWEGKGDRHTVSVSAAAVLLRHPDVWILVESVDTGAPGLSSMTPPAATSEGTSGAPAGGDASVSIDKPQGAAAPSQESQKSGADQPTLTANYAELTLETLKGMAKQRGIATGNSGRDRVIALLQEADASAAKGAQE